MALTKVKAGNILLTTPGASSNDVTPATTQYVTTALANLADSAPSTLNTLNELAAALGDDANFSTTVTNSIAAKLPLAGGELSGTLNITQASTADTIKLTRSTTAQNNMIKFRSAGADKWIVGQRNDSTEHFRFYSYGASSDVLSIQTDGKVGIGETSPANLLHVKASDAGIAPHPSAQIVLERDGTNYLQFLTTAAGTSGLLFGDTNDIDVSKIYVDHNTTKMTFVNEASETMTLNGKKVGIGTASPGVTLDILTSTANTNGVVRIQNNMDNNYEALRIHSLGNFDAQISFLAQGSSTYWGAIGIDYSDAGKFKLQTDNLFAGGSNLMTWARDGKVGIGTTSPSSELDIFNATSPTISLGYNGGGGNGGTIDWNLNVVSTPLTAQIAALDDGNYRMNMIFSTKTSASASSGMTERMRITSSGYLLVGNTSSGGSGKCQADVGFDAQDGSNTTSIAIRNYSSSANSGSIIVDPDNVGANSVMYFGIDGITPAKMKLDSAGRLNIDQVDSRFGSGALNIVGEIGNSYHAIQFRHNASTIVGTVVTTASSTAYNTSSDYRLKENVDYTWDATTRLKQLKPARFNFIVDDTTTLVDGFLAHEVSSIVPEAITGEKDAMIDEEYEITPAVLNADGTIITEAVMGTHSVPNYQSIDQSKLVPLLVKTIQELEARITTLEG